MMPVSPALASVTFLDMLSAVQPAMVGTTGMTMPRVW